MEEGNLSGVVRLVLQLALILFAAKLGGEVFERWLKQPGVLGEVLAGMIISPYALGRLSLPGLGPLFPVVEAIPGIPVSSELYALAEIAAVILLFHAGLNTDFHHFFRYAGPALVVAMGGVIIPFFLGVLATVLLGFADGLTSPTALFVGTVMVATSVGITARVLTDIEKLDTPEGVTILAAAVIDDVLGILVLTIVVGMTLGGGLSLGTVAWVGGKALLFWGALVGGGILVSRHLARFFLAFRGAGAALALALAVGFLAAALAQYFGLAMIIGAYSIGLALSNTKLRSTLEQPMASVYHALVPVFFVVMGMLVNFPAMRHALLLGVVISVLAIIGKIVGCGGPALGLGFNPRGALRVGLGMMPRGEVALIIAGVGLTRGVIGQDIFGVAVMMTIVTTLPAPVLLVPAFRRGGSGRRGKSAAGEHPALQDL